MDLINDVFTQRQLPEDAEKWGREVEQTLVAAAVTGRDINSELNNMQRSIGGSLAVTSRNIIELNARKMLSKSIPDITTPVIASAFPAPAAPFTITADATMGIPDNKRRKGLATIGLTLNSSNLNVIADITVYIELNGVRVAAIAAQVPQVSSRPKPDWFASNSLVFPFVTDGTAPVLTFNVTGSAFAISGTHQSFVGVTKILSQVSYGPELT